MRRGRINEWQRQRHGIVKNPFGPDDKLVVVFVRTSRSARTSPSTDGNRRAAQP
jgi:hypothetical protein